MCGLISGRQRCANGDASSPGTSVNKASLQTPPNASFEEKAERKISMEYTARPCAATICHGIEESVSELRQGCQTPPRSIPSWNRYYAVAGAFDGAVTIVVAKDEKIRWEPLLCCPLFPFAGENAAVFGKPQPNSLSKLSGRLVGGCEKKGQPPGVSAKASHAISEWCKG